LWKGWKVHAQTEILDKMIYTYSKSPCVLFYPRHVLFLSQNLSPGFFFMAEINHRSCHKDDGNSDLLWLITEEVLFPMDYVYGADD